MTSQVRRLGPLFFVVGAFVALGVFLVPLLGKAEAATYSTPFWTNASPSPECGSCGPCGCPGPEQTYSLYENGGDAPFCGLGGDWRTGELFAGFGICSNPGIVRDFDISIGFRSYLDGGTQVGNHAILSVEHTIEYEVLNALDPDANGGHQVTWQRPDGLTVLYAWDGIESPPRTAASSMSSAGALLTGEAMSSSCPPLASSTTDTRPVIAAHQPTRRKMDLLSRVLIGGGRSLSSGGLSRPLIPRLHSNN